MNRFFPWIVRHPWLVIATLMVPTLFFAGEVRHLRKVRDITNMLPAHHPSVTFLHQIEDTFGVEEGMLIGLVRHAPGGIYHPAALGLLHRLTEKLQAMPGVRTGSVKDLFTVDDIVGTAEGFEVRPLLEAVPTSHEDLDRLRERIDHNRLLRGELASKDGTGVLVHLETARDASTAAVYHEIRAFLAAANDDPDTEVLIAGLPVVNSVVGVYVDQDMRRLFPLIGLVVGGTLALFLRTVRGVVLPMLVILFSVVWAMGAMACLGIPIYPMTTAVPIIIMALGCADGIHILHRFQGTAEASNRPDRRAAILETMEEMSPPVVMTSLTTAVGFLSLLSSDIEPLRYFGVFSALGVMVALVFSLAFLPAVLALLPLPTPRTTAPSSPAALVPGHLDAGGRLLSWMGHQVYARRGCVLLLGLGLLAGAGAGLRLLRVDSDPIRYFDADSEIPRANRIINEHFNGTGLLCIVVDGGRPDAFKDPHLLGKLAFLQEAMDGIEDVGGSLSLADYLKTMNRAMHADRPDQEVVPPSRDEIAQYLLLFSLSGDPEDLERVVDFDFQRANLIVRTKSLSSARIGRVLREANAIAAEIFANGNVTYRIGGRAEVVFVQVGVIVRGQVMSILISILGVLLITTVMFRSLAAGLLSIIPIGVASFLTFGFMSLFGLALNPATAITTCIGIGVGIDYAIHYLSRYRYLSQLAASAGTEERGGPATTAERIQATMVTTGKAIAYNAFVVIFGFLVLLASRFPPTRNMSILVAVNMFTCFLGALTLLPAALVCVVRRRGGRL